MNTQLIKPKTTMAIPVLCIAGSDCSGGAGIQADLKTFSAFNLFGMSVITCVVAENTSRVISSLNIPNDIIDNQLEAIFEDIVPMAVKIGMLNSREMMECVSLNLKKYFPKNIVIDPVMYAKNGFALMGEENRDFFKKTILPYADILTPNIPEAIELCGFNIACIEQMKDGAKKLIDLGAKSVLVKGGHLKECASDLFYDGKVFHIFEKQRIDTKNTHGTGCTLSSAIASNLALGKDKIESIEIAKDYVFNAILYSLNLGQGCGPTNHFYKNIKG